MANGESLIARITTQCILYTNEHRDVPTMVLLSEASWHDLQAEVYPTQVARKPMLAGSPKWGRLNTSFCFLEVFVTPHLDYGQIILAHDHSIHEV